MKNLDLASNLKLEPLLVTNKEIQIEGVYIGDLLSIAMSKAKENFLWITIQTHVNIVAIAELLDLSCIIIVEGMEIEDETLNKAKELDIPIFKTKDSAYQVACRLHTMGIK
ncbi:DRTGG domain-containing protein [Sedimentibacter sp. MB31-C6]|uniref:DRTGG domain-containing protein n=1 Tax=Sedimentibacter sp. MB31-C6 TaxID=3109366 RepID=UPI002DDCD1CA|nr:DRTGG domain-containing protein [Sedimentibacter sp. MB36-C1]WSI04373.1 DRTGG domain-containing protein [Sedimentibacter sp. MB36-C1]